MGLDQLGKGMTCKSNMGTMVRWFMLCLSLAQLISRLFLINSVIMETIKLINYVNILLRIKLSWYLVIRILCAGIQYKAWDSTSQAAMGALAHCQHHGHTASAPLHRLDDRVRISVYT